MHMQNFHQIPSIYSQDTGRKQNFNNKGHNSCKFAVLSVFSKAQELIKLTPLDNLLGTAPVYQFPYVSTALSKIWTYRGRSVPLMILVMKLDVYWGSSTKCTNQSKTSSTVQLYTKNRNKQETVSDASIKISLEKVFYVKEFRYYCLWDRRQIF